MVKASKGPRKRTRSKLRKRIRAKGMSPITRMLENYKEGDKACIVIDPSIHKGQPHPKYHGLTGVIQNAQGNSYVLRVKTGNRYRNVIVNPAHLRRIGD